MSNHGIACRAALEILNKSHTSATANPASHSVIVTVCDPRPNLRVFGRLYLENSIREKRDRSKYQLIKLYVAYKHHQDEMENSALPNLVPIIRPPLAQVESDEFIF